MKRFYALLALLLLAGCRNSGPTPPPPPLYGPYQLTWGNPNPVCTGTVAPPGTVCLSAWVLTGTDLPQTTLGPGLTSYTVGTLAAGSYSYDLYPSGYDEFGNNISGQRVSATIASGPATAHRVRIGAARLSRRAEK